VRVAGHPPDRAGIERQVLAAQADGPEPDAGLQGLPVDGDLDEGLAAVEVGQPAAGEGVAGELAEGVGAALVGAAGVFLALGFISGSRAASSAAPASGSRTPLMCTMPAKVAATLR
jgi:hypothetical protein